jgi:hypothetical protein
MPPRRPNPKKDKGDRRKRPDRPASPVGGRRVHMDMSTVTDGVLAAPPELLPLFGVAAVWLWNAAAEQADAAHCVDACLTMHHALAEFGIGTAVEAVRLAIEGNGSHTLYGGDGPHYNTDGTFNGHAVLLVPEAGRFIDPTIQQYREVPSSTPKDSLPLISRMPTPSALGTQPLMVQPAGHDVLYVPVGPELRLAWNTPKIAARVGVRDRHRWLDRRM